MCTKNAEASEKHCAAAPDRRKWGCGVFCDKYSINVVFGDIEDKGKAFVMNACFVENTYRKSF